MLFVGDWLIYNAVNLMSMLHNFGKASGLQINLQKSRLFVVGVSDDEMNRLADRIHVSTVSLPFVYLGLPIGANMKRVASWKGVEEKITHKLSPWKQKTLSIGGRLTLISQS